MTQIILTSAQEAAFNAAGEAMADLGQTCYFRRRADGGFAVFGYLDPEDDRSPMVHGSGSPVAAEAMKSFLAECEKERAKPQPIRDPAKVREAVTGMIDEYRKADSVPANALDELADRVAALPVKG